MKIKANDFSGLLKWTLRENRWMMLFSAFLSFCTGIYMFITYKDSTGYQPSEYKINITNHMLDIGIMVPIIVFILSFIYIMVNFAFLYSKRQLDFLHASPVKREQLFGAKMIVISLNAVLFVTVSFVTACLLTTTENFFYNDREIFLFALMSIVSALLFIAVVSLFCVAEGRMINAIFASALALVFVPLSVSVFYSCAAYLVSGIVLDIEKSASVLPLVCSYSPLKHTVGEYLAVIAVRAVLAAVIFAAGTYVYKKRKSEIATQAKPSLLTSAVFAVSFSALAFFSVLAGISMSANFPASLLISCIAVCVFLIIYFFAALRFKKKKEILAFLAISVCLLAGMCGVSSALKVNAEKYISYTPYLSEVEKVEINTVITDRLYFTDVIAIMFSQKPYGKRFELRQEESVKAVIQLNKESAQSILSKKPGANPISVTYTLKNGKKVSRILYTIDVNYETIPTTPYDKELPGYTKLLKSPEYIMQSKLSNIGDNLLALSIQKNKLPSASTSEIFSDEDAKTFLQAYKKDVEEIAALGLTENSSPFAVSYFTATFIYANRFTPDGFTWVNVKDSDFQIHSFSNASGETSHFSFSSVSITPLYTNCLKFLESRGMISQPLDISTENPKMRVLYFNAEKNADSSIYSVDDNTSFKPNELEQLFKINTCAWFYLDGKGYSMSKVEDYNKVEALRKRSASQTTQEKLDTVKNNDQLVFLYFTTENENSDYDVTSPDDNEEETYTAQQSTFYILSAQEFDALSR